MDDNDIKYPKNENETPEVLLELMTSLDPQPRHPPPQSGAYQEPSRPRTQGAFLLGLGWKKASYCPGGGSCLRARGWARGDSGNRLAGGPAWSGWPALLLYVIAMVFTIIITIMFVLECSTKWGVIIKSIQALDQIDLV